MKKQIIFLIGFMGAGKTTIGRKLAQKSNFPFLDIDEIIESKMQKSISSLFEQEGESYFRNEEKETLKEIIENNSKAIISTGGGLPCFHNNMELMNKNGITIYLHRPPKELFHRLKKGKENRPLIKGFTDEQLLLYIEETLKERELYYNKAQLILERDQQSTPQIIEMLSKIEY